MRKLLIFTWLALLLSAVAVRGETVPLGKIADHLGNVRTVISQNIGIKPGIDYEPFGKPLFATPERLTFIGKEKDSESDFGDFGVRKYDDDIGRFLSVDPLWEKFRGWSPYHYASNSPINRLDYNGKWDVDVHFARNRGAMPYGVANVRDRQGNIVSSFAVRGMGVGGRDRTKAGADTPTGTYKIEGWKAASQGDRAAYGANDRLLLTGVSGEISDTKRTEIRIHGGRQETQDKNGEWEKKEGAELKNTKGCMRAYDDDIKQMKEVTDKLEAEDKKEKPGTLMVKDDIREPWSAEPARSQP